MIPWIVLITAFVVVLNLGYAALQLWLLERREPWSRLLGLAVVACSMGAP